MEEQKEQEKENKEKKFLDKIEKILNVVLFISMLIGVILYAIFASNRRQGTIKTKPIIYLYPETQTEVTVKLGKPENLTTTYPKYTNEGWKVIANPDGTLIDINTNRSLYSLYWEGNAEKKNNTNEGFVVKGEDTISFLEEKLEVLGLNEREAEEFIVYWLPRLEKNKYNFIRFETMDEINEDMPLEIEPKPDTIIRVMMEYKPLNKKIKVKEQKLSTPERKGFVVVEWGGTKIK